MRKMLKWLAVGVGLGVVIVALIAVNSTETPEQATQRQARAAYVADLQARGVVTRVTCTGNQAFVSPAGWLELDAHGKQLAALALAKWCDDQSSGNRITVIDAQSGQKLASVSGGSYRVH